MDKRSFKAQFSAGRIGDQGDIKQRIAQIAEYIYDNCLKFKGEASAEEIEAVKSPTNLDVYKVTSAGVVNAEDKDNKLTVSAGSVVKYNASNGLWEDFMSITEADEPEEEPE